MLSRLELRSGNVDAGLACARRAFEINRYDSDIAITLGSTLVQAGMAEEGLPLIERAIRTNPYAPSYYMAELALARLVTGDPESALDALKTISRPVLHSRQTKIVALVELGRMEEAKALAAELLADDPETTAARSMAVSGGPMRDSYSRALIAAGLPAG